MDLTLSESERLVRDQLRGVLSREVPVDLVVAAEESGEFPTGLWRLLAEQGWLGIGVPAEQGGFGGSVVEWVLALEEMGRVACPAPVVEHLASALYLAGTDDARRFPLADVAAGRLIVTLATQDKPGADVAARPDGGATVELNGTKMLVPYGQGATTVILPARTPDSTAYIWLDASGRGVSITPIHSVSRNQQTLLDLDGVRGERIGLPDPDPRRDLVELYMLASDAFALGLMGRMVEISVNYVKDRVQFGRPIGAFQAVQHRCADMVVAYLGAQILVYKAAWLLSQGKPAKEALLMSHANTRDAVAIVTADAHQVHGAMGFMMEYPLHQFSRRAKIYEITHGPAAVHHERLAQLWQDEAAVRSGATNGRSKALVPH